MNPFPRISLKAAFRIWQRDASVYSRSYKMNILPNFFEPLLYLLGMGLGLGAYVVKIKGYSYLEYIAPGLLASSVMFGASFETTYNVFVKMNFDKIYDGILGTPVNPRDIAMGELLWGTTRSLIYGGAFYIILLFFGIGTSMKSLLIIPVILLTGFLFSTIGLLFTSIVKQIELYNYFFTLFITPLFLFSGIFFPLDQFPHILQNIAWFTPLYHAVNLSRGILLGEGVGTLWSDVLWMIIVSWIILSLVVEKFHKRLYK
jgi:lipooligosaccharide transport system permease protein